MLNATKIKEARARESDYKLADSQGLYLLVTSKGRKYWRLKYRIAGKEKKLAIGIYPDVSLKDARTKRDEARRVLATGSDPGQLKKLQKLTQKTLQANSFETIAKEWHGQKIKEWSEMYALKVLQRMQLGLFPDLGKRPITEITPPELLAVLRKTEGRGKLDTARRLKQLSGQVFRFAVATGRAERDITADLKGTLAVAKTSHHAAVTDLKSVMLLMRAIQSYQGTPVVEAALKLSPLLFCRPGELRHMEWQEIDWQAALWEIPASKMKMSQPHVVPLAKQSLAILGDLQKLTGHRQYVFPSARSPKRPMSENAVRVALRTMGFDNNTITPHGFRAIARTLLDEQLGYRIDWIEHQLAHAVKDPNGRAYNRTTHIEGRREMMQAWADYLSKII